MLFALIGNQNSGKTTLFNQLTGSNQHVGNFPGVTVEKKEGTVRKHKEAKVVDLPGIYSLSPYSDEEVVTRDFLIKEKPDGIINILDATNIERNLYLTLQLIELNIPMVIALNMMDEVLASGNAIDIAILEKELGLPVIPISASKNEGVDELIETAIITAEHREGHHHHHHHAPRADDSTEQDRAKHHGHHRHGQHKNHHEYFSSARDVSKPLPPRRLDFCTGALHKAIHSIAHIVEDKAKAAGYPVRFAATKLVEGDPLVAASLSLSEMDLDIIGHIVDDAEKALGTDREAALADMRYSFIERLCSTAVIKQNETKEQLRSVKIDRVLTHKLFALPIFLGIMMLVFYLTFGSIGALLSDWFTLGIDAVTALVDNALSAANVSAWMHSFIIDGVFTGVGSILSFLPVIIVLFFFLSMLEDSGYMARVAFVMDKLLRKIGLSGRSFVPMLIGFGCSVPAIMATRTLSSERDRKMTILLTPFMSCSAKLPIYAVFASAFFPGREALVMIALYVIGMLVAILSGLLLKNTLFKGKPVPFVMELPAYRMPSAKSVVLHMLDKAKDFVRRAFTIIFLASIIIWFLQSMNWGFDLVQDSSNSILATIGTALSPIFAPLGFGDWRLSTALITGLTAKEAVISTLAVLTNAGGSDALAPLLQQLMSPLSAFAFLCFTLLYMPCVAAMAATKREMGSAKGAALAMAYQTAVAWIVAFLIFQVGTLLGL